MSPLRRAILALVLMAGLVPVMAQVPPPVPTLPDTERRTSYNITASTCVCSVGFALYSDSNDYGNWIEVFVNGVQVSSVNWTITSPTGPIATIPRPITDAILTFNGIQTGTVQIVGAQHPRRTTLFTEGRGVAARDLNYALNYIISMVRETWDKINDVTGRIPRAPPGETLTMFPPAANRANMNVCFDSGGNMVPCVPSSSGSFSAGQGITFTGTNPTTISTVLVPNTTVTVVPPQVRITLTSGVAVMTGSVTSAFTVYVTPTGGGLIPIYNGSSFSPVQFAEVSQATTDTTKSPAAVATSSNYDLFCWTDSGSNRCTRGPAWTSNTTRGTGAGTSELQLINGIYVNKYAITNGPAANLGTYVGSIHSNGSATIDYVLGGAGSGGVAVSLGVWNMYNRVLTTASSIDNGAPYVYSAGAARQARGSTGNQATVMVGMVEDALSVYYAQRGDTSATAGSFGETGIGFDACLGVSTLAAFTQTPAAGVFIGNMRSTYDAYPSLGSHFYCAVEAGDGSNVTYNGGSAGTFTVKVWN